MNFIIALNSLKEILTLVLMLPIIVIFGGFLSVKLKFIQITKLPHSFSLVTSREKKNGISSFSALAAVLGGNLGTGNISGVAVAIAAGGPGALFWMWVMAILASITKYAECFLGVHFQERDESGEWVGGPMYYLSKGFRSPLLARFFCVLTMLGALSVGNLVQVHSLFVPLQKTSIHPLILGVALAFLVGGVIWGGLKRFSSVVSAIVPFMATSYICACLVILIIMRAEFLPSIYLIISSAFSFEPVISGALGYSITQAISAGFDRGLFATDSGLGLSSIIHGAVHNEDPAVDNRIKQGLISVLSPMIVMLVCTMTGLVILTTKAYLIPDLFSTNMPTRAFQLGLGVFWAGHIVTVTLFFFAFTTILTWSFCADKAIEFLCGRHWIHTFQLLFIAIIPLGSILKSHSVWIVADIIINLMFIVNMIGIIGLAQLIMSETKQAKKT